MGSSGVVLDIFHGSLRQKLPYKFATARTKRTADLQQDYGVN